MAGAAVAAAGGIQLGATRAPRRQPDLLIVPGMDLSHREGSLEALARRGPEIAFAARTFKRGIPVAAVCVGAFILGAAGLLDGRRATTSWLFAHDLAARFPLAAVDPAALLVDDGGVTTTGSFSAAFDLALHLIGRVAPPNVRRAVARMGLLDAQRSSQAPFVDQGMLARRRADFAGQVMASLEQRLGTPYNLDELAAAFHVSSRTLLRRFKTESGITPLAHLQQARVAQARRLLEAGADSVARVTEKVGYGDVATFGALFKRIAGLTPAGYRRRFRTQAR